MRRDPLRSGYVLTCSLERLLTQKGRVRAVRFFLRAITWTTFLLAANAVLADVVIYQASYTYKSDADSIGNAPKKGSAFFLFDFANRKTGIILLDPAKKRILAANPPESDFQFATPNLLGGKTATVITADGSTDSTDPENYNNSFFYFRGENKSLKVRTQPTTQVQTAPRTLNGMALSGAKYSGGSHFVELRFLLVFQATRTVAANNADKTIDQVLDDTVAELKAKGFTGP